MISVFADVRSAPDPAGSPQGKGPGSSDQRTSTEAFGLLGALDIFAPLPPVHFLVEGAIPAGSLGLMTGYGGERKSWVALALALSCATGSTWLGMPCDACDVVVLDYENLLRATKRRIQRLARGHGHALPLASLDLGRPKVSLSDRNFESFLMALAQERPKVKLIIIDTIRAACPGADENASTIREHLDRLRNVAELHGLVIVLLAHARKANLNTSGAYRRERIRGSSALFDAVDVVFDITAATNGDLSIQQTKGRESKEFLALNARLVDIPSGDIRLELVQQGVGSLAPPDLDQAVLAAVERQQGCSMANLLPVLKGRKEDVSAAVHRLLSNGLLVNRGHGRPFKLHVSVPTVPAISSRMYPSAGSAGGSPKGVGTAEPGDEAVPGTSGNYGNHKGQFDA